MRRFSLCQPSPSMAVALLALFCSLGGTGYAASSLVAPKATTEAAHKAKTAKPLSSSQVNKLIAAYFSSHLSQLQGRPGAVGSSGSGGSKGEAGGPGTKGETGSTGTKGGAGPTGATGMSGYQQVAGSYEPGTGSGFNEASAEASCPAGKKVIGGGFDTAGSDATLYVGLDEATSETNWVVSTFSATTAAYSIRAFAICVRVAE